MSVVRVDKNVAERTLLIVAEFDTSIEHAWRLWSDPRLLERWWGPPTHPATVHEHDLKPGGEVRYAMTGPRGEISRGWWRVTAVDPPRWLEFTDGYADRHGRPDPDRPATRVSVRLSEGGGLTRMEMRFRFDSDERMRQLERLGAFEVFPQSVAQMDALLVRRE